MKGCYSAHEHFQRTEAHSLNIWPASMQDRGYSKIIQYLWRSAGCQCPCRRRCASLLAGCPPSAPAQHSPHHHDTLQLTLNSTEGPAPSYLHHSSPAQYATLKPPNHNENPALLFPRVVE